MTRRSKKSAISPYLFIEKVFEGTGLAHFVLSGELHDAVEECARRKRHLICVTFQDCEKYNKKNIKQILSNPKTRLLIEAHCMIYGAYSYRGSDISPFSSTPIPYSPAFEVLKIEKHMTELHPYRGHLKDKHEFYLFLRNTVYEKRIPTPDITESLSKTNVESMDFTSRLMISQDEKFQSLAADQKKEKGLEALKQEKKSQIKKNKEKEKRIERMKQSFIDIRTKNSTPSAFHGTELKDLVLKVKYPDGVTKTFKYDAEETVGNLHKNIISENPSVNSNFHICTCRPGNRISTYNFEKDFDERTLLEVGLATSQFLFVEYLSDDEDPD